ncbi:hypothetical protein ACHAPU_010792 [Fusarium lateritium]
MPEESNRQGVTNLPTMANQEAKIEPPKSSIYPDLHYYVAESLDEDDLEYSFRDHDTKTDIKREYHTRTIGNFTCGKHTCGHKWSSNSVSITIREYEDKSYNALVYHQLCSRCRKSTRADLDKLCYADRIAFRLKKWNGIQAQQLVREVEHNGPHKKELCEGCKNGLCGEKKVSRKF